MGGSDDPSNLIELTIGEHAEAHKKLYEQYGHWQDLIAWKGLSGQIGYEEVLTEVYRYAGKKGGSAKGYKFTEEGRLKLKEARKKQWDGKSTFYDWTDKNHSDAAKSKISTSALSRESKECPHCKKLCKPHMYSRWHGDKCKSKQDTI
jgi:hypothetical protein